MQPGVLMAVCRGWCPSVQVDSQSLSVAINEGLEQGLVVGDGLQDVAISRHISDGPLTEPSAAEPENVAEEQAD